MPRQNWYAVKGEERYHFFSATVVDSEVEGGNAVQITLCGKRVGIGEIQGSWERAEYFCRECMETGEECG